MARLLLLLERGVIVAGHGNGFGSFPSMPLAIGLFLAVGILLGFCAHQPAAKEKPDTPVNKKTSSNKKLVTRTFSRNKTISNKNRESGGDDHEHEIRVDISSQVPVPLSTLPPPPPQRKKGSDGGGNEKKGEIMGGERVSRGGFGEGG